MRQGLIKALTLFLALLSLDVFAQEMKVSGTVFDNEGQPLLGGPRSLKA